MYKLKIKLQTGIIAAVLSSLLIWGMTSIASTEPPIKTKITEIEISQPPINLQYVNWIWERLKKEIGAPDDLLPPPIAIDWEVPIYARMGTQYPTKEFPDYRMQISIAPRTIDSEPDTMVLFGIGHELVHYLFIMRENNYEIKETYTVELMHHCNMEFQDYNRIVIDVIWNIYHMSKARMNDELVKSCSNHGGQ